MRHEPKKDDDKGVRQTITFRAVDLARIEALTADMQKEVPPEVLLDRQTIVRAALREACIARGLEQRADVEPQDRAGDTVPPGASS